MKGLDAQLTVVPSGERSKTLPAQAGEKLFVSSRELSLNGRRG